MNAKSLSKEVLSETYGIAAVSRSATGEWKIGRYVYNRAGRCSMSVICPYPDKGREDKGLFVSFSYKGKSVRIALNRLVYVWYIGDLNDSEFIGHLNGDMGDCSVWNLVKVDETSFKAMLKRTKKEIERDAVKAEANRKRLYGEI